MPDRFEGEWLATQLGEESVYGTIGGRREGGGAFAGDERVEVIADVTDETAEGERCEDLRG